jgi:inositol transport system permease protein
MRQRGGSPEIGQYGCLPDAAVIGGTSLSGGIGRITGTVNLGVMTSGFTILRIDAYCREIVKGMTIVAAVIVDQYRQRPRKKA